MKKNVYEYLMSYSKDLYDNINTVSMRLCSLKSELNSIINIIEKEYNNKYNKTSNQKTPLEQGVFKIY